MLAFELVDVALQMLRRNLVKGSLVRPLEHGPERLDSIHVRHAVNVLADRVLERLVRVRDAFVGHRIVRVDRRVRVRHFVHEALQRGLVGRADNPCLNLVGGAALRADHGRHVHRTPPLEFLAFGVRFVPALAAEMRCVKFHRTSERTAVLVAGPCFPDSGAS